MCGLEGEVPVAERQPKYTKVHSNHSTLKWHPHQNVPRGYCRPRVRAQSCCCGLYPLPRRGNLAPRAVPAITLGSCGRFQVRPRPRHRSHVHTLPGRLFPIGHLGKTWTRPPQRDPGRAGTGCRSTPAQRCGRQNLGAGTGGGTALRPRGWGANTRAG